MAPFAPIYACIIIYHEIKVLNSISDKVGGVFICFASYDPFEGTVHIIAFFIKFQNYGDNM